jgi:hypothetical protein
MTDTQREQRIREAGIEAITQSTAVAKINRAIKTRTTPDGRELYKTGDLIDYHRPTATKDEHGGWNGPYPVVRNEPDRGQVVCRTGKTEVNIRYPDARHTLFVEAIFTMELGLDNEPMDIMLDHISKLHPGKHPETFGYSVNRGCATLTTASRNSPKVFLALQYVIRNFFRINDVIAVRLGKNIHSVSKCDYADSSILVHYTSDLNPDFHFYETEDTAINIANVTQSHKSRIIQCLMKRGCHSIIEDSPELAQELMPSAAPPQSQGNDAVTPAQQPEPPTLPEDDHGGRLPTIYEEDETTSSHADELIVESFYAELMSDSPLQDDPTISQLFGNGIPMPVYMMPEDTVLFMAHDEDQVYRGCAILEKEVYIAREETSSDTQYIDRDDNGPYVEMCFPAEMSKIVLAEEDYDKMQPDDIATLRVYISAETKRSVVVKEDDLLSKKELVHHTKAVGEATTAEIKTWLQNSCFKKTFLKDAQNIMTSRYVAKWKWVKDATGKWNRIIRMRLVLRGFMDLEAFSLDTFSGTAKRSSQRMLASETACHPDWILASLDVDKAFLKGFTYKELADATGEKERTVCFKLPPGSATLLRRFPGFEDYDETIHCLQCEKPGTGTKDAPRAFSMKLRHTTKNIGLKPTIYDPEFEIMDNLLTAKHVDDVNMGGTEKNVDFYSAEVEKTFGKCKLNKHTFTNCGVRYASQDNHDIHMDQDEYIKTMRPIVSSELTGAAAEKDATKLVADLFVSLRGALAYTTLTQAWIQVYIVALQRVQWPKNIDVRRLNAITRKLQKEPKKLIFAAMTCSGTVDIHTDSGYRRVTDLEDLQKGYGMRGMCLLRRGINAAGIMIVHLLESICRSHRLAIRSSYGAELLAASHGYEDAYPMLITLVELKYGKVRTEELKKFREEGGLKLQVNMTTDAESVYKSLTSRDLKAPTEKTLLGHVCWIRELLQLRLIETIQWCDTRDMTADGHTKGSIERDLLLQLMAGNQAYKHDVKRYTPHRTGDSAAVDHGKGDVNRGRANHQKQVSFTVNSTQMNSLGGLASVALAVCCTGESILDRLIPPSST